MSAYEAQANAFLAKYGIKFAAAHKGEKEPPWSQGKDYGDHFRVTLKRPGKSISFDFWGSVNDRDNGKRPTAYDVLAYISGDYHCPDTFEDFCSQEYGYDPGRKAEQTFKACQAMTKKLHQFFSEDEARDLSEIMLGDINEAVAKERKTKA